MQILDLLCLCILWLFCIVIRFCVRWVLHLHHNIRMMPQTLKAWQTKISTQHNDRQKSTHNTMPDNVPQRWCAQQLTKEIHHAVAALACLTLAGSLSSPAIYPVNIWLLTHCMFYSACCPRSGWWCHIFNEHIWDLGPRHGVWAVMM